MRAPSELRRRKARPNRGRIFLIVLAIALVLFITSLRGLAGFYTDYLWFDSLGMSGVFKHVLGAKVALAFIFTGIFFVLCWVNLWIADRIAPRFRPAGPEEEFVERYQELIGRRTGLVRIVVSLLFGLIAGVGTSSQWRDWILFTHRVDFGQKDPLFHTDVGFYVFTLPFLRFLVNWMFAAVLIVIIITAVAHYLNGGIRVQTPGQRVTPQVKAHLSVLLAVLALLKGAAYWLQRYGLTFSTRGFVNGAGYTDVKAQLPAINLLILISFGAAVLLLVNIRRRGWVLPVIAVGLWAFVAVIAGAVYPAFIQRFQVQPAESTKELPYIARNIESTRSALGLDKVDTADFPLTQDVSAADLSADDPTLTNVRLLDPNIVLPTFQRVQGIRSFYQFNDLDVDRYPVPVGGPERQVVLGVRELNSSDLPQDTWEGRHLAYTHGYALAAALANTVTVDGRPDFVVKDLPPTGDLPLEQAAVYFGENLSAYVVVDTDRQEVDYVKEDGTTQTTTYKGDGGVSMGSFVRRAAFALRFGDINPLISNFITGQSKILYVRDVAERVRLLAPFLDFDSDPYPVVVDKKLVWIIDGYTTSAEYPYAQRAVTGQLPPGSDLGGKFNYVRNSVKAVVDAYTGSVTFYVVDPSDPLIRSYEKAFPNLFTDGSKMSDALRAHLRYPEDLFRLQTNMWGRYHIQDAAEFYSQSDAWSVAQDPGTVAGVVNTTQTTDSQGRLGPGREQRIDPYYLLMQLPGESKVSYVLLRPFVPFSDNDSRKELVAFMTASSDPDDYGQLKVFVMPRNRLPDGPALVAANIASEEDISAELTLLDQQGSQVRQGNLLLVPVGESLLYVRPLYTQAAGATAVPELKKVIVTFNGNSYMRDTLGEALQAAFGEAPPTANPTPNEPGTGPSPGTSTPPNSNQSVASLLSQADAKFREADAALKNGDLSAYQAAIDDARNLVEQAAVASGVTAPSTTEPSAPTSVNAATTTVASA